MSKLTGVATQSQRDLAEHAGKKLPRRIPRLVAAARLRSILAADLLGEPDGTLPDYLNELLDAISDEANVKISPEPRSKAEGEAWLVHLRLKVRMAALRVARPNSGDLVVRIGGDPDSSDIFEVSSIGDDGVVWLKGGRGARSWPDLVSVVKPRNEKEELDLRRRAANRAASLQPPSFSSEHASDLAVFKPSRAAELATIDELRETIEAATDEAPIQLFLAAHPELLSLLLRRPQCYVRPQVRLGKEYVADFIIGDVDSTGPRWLLVELETPNSSVALATKNQFEKHTRDGIAQINEWRAWIEQNLAYARQPLKSNGCGLPGIQATSTGLVIVGRRHLQHHRAAALKRQELSFSQIEVHSYDWLVEQLEGSLENISSPVFNPYIVARREVAS